MICPNCGYRLAPKDKPQPQRICFQCGKVIGRGHKFHFVGGRVKHRVCEDPEAYWPKDQLPLHPASRT